MSLVFAAIVPHSALFIPSIGKNNAAKLRRTIDSIKIISKNLVASKPNVIVCLINHFMWGQKLDDTGEAVFFNINSRYKANFEEFGDFGTSFYVPGDALVSYNLKRRFDTLRDKHSIVVTSREQLDGSMSAALFYLLSGQSHIGLVPINDTITRGKPEFLIGERLRRPIYQDQKRIAVIATVNLSHLNDSSAAGFSPKSKSFDQRVINSIMKKNVGALTRIKNETLEEVSECAVRPLLMLFGMMNNTNYSPELLSYESPFGIGHAVISLNI